jgi:hypothetical protein
MAKQTKKNAPPKRVQLPKKVRKKSGKKKPPKDQQELTRIWNEDLCE